MILNQSELYDPENEGVKTWLVGYADDVTTVAVAATIEELE